MATATDHIHPPMAPGPRGHLLWGSLPEVQRDPLRLYMESRRRFGDVVRFRSLGSQHWHLISHPHDIEHVLRKRHQNYPKGFAVYRLKLLVGEGLLTSEGEYWRRHRRLAQPAFHRKRLAALAAVMTSSVEDTLRRWHPLVKQGQPFDVSSEIMRLTLQVVSKALFSTDVSGEADAVGRALTVALEHVNYRSLHLFSLPERIPTPRNLRFRRALRVLDSVVFKLIEQRRRSGQDTGDLLSMLLQARDEETGAGMNDKQLRDEIMTILLAGHETTAVALTWTWYLLGQHPEAEANLHAELDTVLGGRTPTVEDLPRLPCTKMVIEEALRLYPPAWGVIRQPIEADELGGYAIPAGSPLMICWYVTHRHPEFWDAPEAFEPERFTPERTAGRPAFAYAPFGGGPRLCIGNNFAMMEAQLILATLAQHYRLRLVPGHPVEPQPMVTLRPKYGMRMTVQARKVSSLSGV